MKQFLVGLSAIALLLVSPVTVAAQNVASPAAQRSAVVDKRVTNLQTRGAAEVDRRITSLNSWLSRVTANPNLDLEAKTALTTKIQTEIASLTALKSEIQSDSELATLRTSVKSIRDAYRVYALVLPQTSLVVTANRVEAVATRMATISAELEADLADNTSRPVQNALTSLKTKVANALSLATRVENAVLALMPQGYPGNRSTLTSSRSQLQTAIRDLRAAREDIDTLMEELETTPATGSGTASGSAAPSIGF